MTPPPAPPIRLLRNLVFSGFMPGWQQPLAVIDASMAASHDAARSLAVLHATMLDVEPALTLPPPPSPAGPEQTARYLLDCLQALLGHAQYPLLAVPACETHVLADGEIRLRLLLPSFGPAHTALNAAAATLLRLAAGDDPDANRQRLQRVVAALAAQCPRPGVSVRLLQAAAAAGVPWLHVCENAYQFGWGRASCIFDSSCSEHTGNIGARMARQKHQAAQVLRQAGLPVPRHELVTSAEHAVKVAAKLGYPVVVKPADLDQGTGVSTNLQTPEQVVEACNRARAHSPKVLVETHIEGRDFRVIVVRGKVLRATERVPAQMIGDGQRDVSALIEEFNRDPRRQPSAQRLHQVSIDDEVLSLLAAQGLHVGSVPASGQHVRLRRSANISTGGTPVNYTLDQVHPDNLLLCQRAAAALRLDIAGIDLLIRDIGRSWRDIGGVICEVNSQPQMQFDLPKVMLEQIIADDGRIPVVAIIAAAQDTQWWRETESFFPQRGLTLGVADAGSVRLNAATIAEGGTLAHGAGILLREPGLCAALFIATDRAQINEGAPVDRLDLLIVTASSPAPTLLQLLQPRSAALWCVDHNEEWVSRLTAVQPTIVASDRLAAALQEFLEARL